MRQACCFIAPFALSAAPLVAEGISDPFKWNFQARVRGEMRQNAYDFDSSRSAEGDDAFDLRLASIELGDPQHLSVKLGRQVLSLRDERLACPPVATAIPMTAAFTPSRISFPRIIRPMA
jgi:hypothetical protein